MAQKKKSDAASGEDRLLARHFRPIATDPAALGLLDDSGLLRLPTKHELVLTADTLIAGVHFLPDDPPELIARKALRVNLSDLAAKGADPLGALLALSLPENTSDEWLAEFARGLGEDCEAFDCPLLGGDTTRTPALLTLSITALGSVPRGKMVKRSGARPGDVMIVTGTIGDAALGLRLLRTPTDSIFASVNDEARARLTERYRLPRPRLALTRALREHATASIDVSDGLAGDAGKMAAASGCAARLEAKRVPLSAPARAVLSADPKLIDTLLGGGDDYEIVAAIPPRRLDKFQKAAREAGVEATTIGRIEKGEGLEIVDAEGKPITLERASYSHF